jgi:CRISPR/Cas system CSM-associated protein Csm4 (group 5 of RAMP superfamily)
MIKCKNKIGVDPEPKAKATVCCTSDEFFKKNRKKFDLIFIDGLHHWEQVERDFDNSLKCLSENGTIVFHDCNPVKEIHQIVPRQVVHWNGDVWKAWVDIRHSYDGLEMFVIDIDEGCGIIRRNEKYKKCDCKYELTYQNLERNREEMLNLISIHKFKEWLING